MGTVLHVGAHPDDENTELITWLSRGRGYRTGYLSMTRGDGGQNELGPEFGEKLGVIRTQELLAARRLDGGRQFFTRAIDFGFSKNPEETLRFWDSGQVLSDVVRVIRRFRPDVMTTYNEFGGYGHPDHVQTHRVTMRAVQLAAWSVPKLYWIVVPRAAVAAQLAELARPDNPFAPWPDGALLRTAIEDGAVTAAIGGVPELTAAKAAALRAHATQISVREPYFALSHGLGQVIASREYFHLARGSAGPASQLDAAGHELDLFAGLD